MKLESRLPSVGTTIFTVMSRLAADLGAINLSQGFPDFDCDPALVDAVAHHMRSGRNQYAPMQGVAALREAIAAKFEAFHGRVGPDIGAAVRFDDGHLAEFHARSKRSQPHAARQRRR